MVKKLFPNSRVGIKGLWFVRESRMNFLIPRTKIRKASIFHESFIPKYDNFRIISAGDIYLSICLELTE